MRRGLYVLFGFLMVPIVGFAGDIQTDGKLKSTLASGAPLEVASSSMVVNLNADMVDGVQGTEIYTKAEVDALVAAATASAGHRRFYIVATPVSGGNALTACATGFHMATFFEISEPSTLIYAYNVSGAWTRADSGVGPPTCAEGWVRTGLVGDATEVVGVANCELWTLSSQGSYGTVARLPCNWSNPTGGAIYVAIQGTPYVSRAYECSEVSHVWCVED